MEAARLKREGIMSAPTALRPQSQPITSAEASPEFPRRWKKDRRWGLLGSLVFLLLVGLAAMVWFVRPDQPADLVPEVADIDATPEAAEVTPAPVVAPASVAEVADVGPTTIQLDAAPDVPSVAPQLAALSPDVGPSIRSVLSPIVFRLQPLQPLEPAADIAPAPDAPSAGPADAEDPLQLAVSDAVAEAMQQAVLPLEASRRPPNRPDLAPASSTPIAPSAFQTDSILLHLPATFPATQMAGILTQLGAVGHAPADIRRFDFNVSQTQVRYFRETDGGEARKVGDALGATVRDFTWFDPKPRAGQIEVWIAP